VKLRETENVHISTARTEALWRRHIENSLKISRTSIPETNLGLLNVSKPFHWVLAAVIEQRHVVPRLSNQTGG
jgi:hypothetical protein